MKRMGIIRPLGVKLISALYFVKSLALTIAIVVATIRPDLLPVAQKFAAELAPLLKVFHSSLGMMIAPFFVVLGIAIGVGIWCLSGWAYGLLIVMCGVSLIRLAQFLVACFLVNHKWLSLLPSSPLFAIDVTTSIFIVAYLLRPEVKQAFGDPN